ncbi:proteophosphoglycan ppg4 [Rhodotorula toruloides]|uniref:Proteophosphoglycan ppg4 n=1 Tax=Rhodotorula toruloides TaxID=5286 RepID=A0A511KIC4_RHOTO|nr:proteophosphoglycan ppg4 [Rhodotorula toruloides]
MKRRIHVVRMKYFQHQLRSTSASSDSEVLAALPGQGVFTPPAAEPHSLWPIFAIPPPTLDASRLVTLWNCDDWSRFTFPAPPPDAVTAAASLAENDSATAGLDVTPGSSTASAPFRTTEPAARTWATPGDELRRRHPQKA